MSGNVQSIFWWDITIYVFWYFDNKKFVFSAQMTKLLDLQWAKGYLWKKNNVYISWIWHPGIWNTPIVTVTRWSSWRTKGPNIFPSKSVRTFFDQVILGFGCPLPAQLSVMSWPFLVLITPCLTRTTGGTITSTCQKNNIFIYFKEKLRIDGVTWSVTS